MDTAEILKKVRQIEIQTNKLVSETFAGEYLSAFKGQGIEFAEVREYTSGDDVRAIDWNVTARTGVPFIKKYNETRELTLVIACDVSASQRFGSVDKLKQETAAELAALFAFSAMRNNDKVGLLLFSDKIELFVPPKKGKKHILRLIRELVAFEPQGHGTDMALALKTLVQVLRRQGILVLISDYLSPLEQFEKPLKLAAKKFDLIPVVVTDKLERGLPACAACMTVVDPETGQEGTLALTAAMNQRLQEDARQRTENLTKLFNPLKVEPITVDTAQPAADPVIAFFRRRTRQLKR
ncbi:MAG: DUF58 domain-containing protein [Elusimicrobiaceae bacterium]|uniref:DUF58 domain-containing protein n=1 Tax=Candidatus Avelusimicrobium faecicola TaxID=3416205 RepID=UPI002A772F2D|nr:DUF58 domain-containing protein [Spirochaetota bacterium]MDY2940150.1 DUF58 domain-containing protein [Elusimicrobiaceae bacterium]